MSEDYSAQQPTAMWNPARGVWEIPRENILCEHLGLFSATFPTSGMMRDGKLFPLPLLAHHTDVNGYSSLPTPTAQAAKHGSTPDTNANSFGQNLWDVSVLFPTPTVVDLGNNKTVDEWEAWTDAQRAKHGNGNGHGASLSIEAQKLLPTPNTMDMLPARTGEALERTRKRGDMSRTTLTTISNLREAVVNDLLPTPMASMKGASKNEIAQGNPRSRLEVEVFVTSTWGKFAPAIHQWETITGNPVPPPTIPDGKDGQHRLNPQFAEWMMGLPAGWITGCDITRNEQLKACGNGVVPQQATLAITRLMAGLNP